MLAIMNLLVATELAGRKQVGIAATADRPRLEADHAAEHELPAACRPFRHSHQPIDASGLMTATVARLVQVLQEGILVGHEYPRTLLSMQHVHGRRIWKPARA